MEWSVTSVLLLILGAAAGGFINGLAGFGTALMSLGIWLEVMPPEKAVAIVALMSVVSGVQSLWLIRREIRPGLRRLPRFLIPALAGLPLGAYILSGVTAGELKLLLASLMLLYGVYFLFKRSLPTELTPHPAADCMVGFAGGLLGGAASLSGVLPSMWCAMQPWTKMETSAVLRPYNIAVLSLAAAAFAVNGIYSWETLLVAAAAIPVSMAVSAVGIAVFRRLTDTVFRRLLIFMLFASGLLILVQELPVMTVSL